MVTSGLADRRLAAAFSSRYWREEQARVVLEAWVASGLSVAAFARAHGLTARRVLWWKRWLMPGGAEVRESSADLGATILPVHVLAGDSAGMPEVEAEEGRPARLEVVLRGGRVVRVPDGFGAATLARVVQTLEALGC